MGVKVGIPRGLFYYQYYPLWKTFLEELGAEVILSEATTKKILDEGVKTCVDEACLPVKIYHGHVESLKDRVDYLFIPRLTSVSKNEYICPKFGGLPDMIRRSICGLPRIIDIEVNLRKSKKNALTAAHTLGSYFCDDPAKVRAAFKKAADHYKNVRYQLIQEQLSKGYTDHKKLHNDKTGISVLNMLVIGHVYNLYDSYINMNMLKKLQDYNVNVLTLDKMDELTLSESEHGLHKRMFWNFGRKAVGGVAYALENEEIDGIAYLMSFGCGVDSFVSDLVERKIRRNRDIPFIVLSLDEHSGEAGMNTRIEAFIDMIRWRKK